MTLIIWINLSDRLYIAGDTRVTFGDRSYSDDIIKVAPLVWKVITNQEDVVKWNTIVCSVVWDLNTAQYLYWIIRKWINDWVLSSDIRDFYCQIKDFVFIKYWEWLMKWNAQKRCWLIFWGTTPNRKKEIDLETLNRLTDELNSYYDEGEAERMEVKKKALSQPWFQAIMKYLWEELALQAFDDPKNYRLNSILQEAKETESNQLNCSDSLICSLLIENDWIYLEKAEWWELLAYWTDGIDKNTISSDVLATAELHLGSRDKWSNSTETASIRDEIMHIAKKLWIVQIWGIVTPFIMRNNWYLPAYFHTLKKMDWTILEDVWINRNWPYFMKEDWIVIQLTEFFTYKTNASASL